MRVVTLFGLLMTLGSGISQAATISASSCGRDHVEAAIDAAKDGDTVLIPAGTCTWTTSLIITQQALTVQGAGPGVTTIVDGIVAPLSDAKPPALAWRTNGNQLKRLTGLTFDGGTLGGLDQATHAGIVAVSGNTTAFRLDHVVFENLNRTVGVQVTGSVTGVINHVEFNVGSHYGLYIFHDSWQGVGAYGDNSWAQPNEWGTSAFMFVEDCRFVAPLGTGIVWSNDGWMGQRVVFRRNVNVNALWANHGTETSGRERSARAAEVYQNTFVLDNPGWKDQLCCLNSVIGIRGGTALVWGNELTSSNGAGAKQIVDVANLRSTDSRTFYIFNHCDGFNGWDQNLGPEPGYRCIDQPGAGQGDLLSGDVPTPRWLNQRSEPIYVWDNRINGELSHAAANGDIPVLDGRDLYNLTPLFVGAQGVGAGPAVTRPRTCVAGVAYWAADEGEWDSTNGKAPDGRLYTCVRTNTWALSYTPYSYPHPLVTAPPR